MAEAPAVFSHLSALRRASEACAAAFLPVMLRDGAASPRIHGIEAASDAAVGGQLAALDGLALERVLPLESMPTAGRLGICLDDRPPLAEVVACRGPMQAVGTSLLDEDARLVGVFLLLWRSTSPLEANQLRRLRRRCDARVRGLTDAWSATLLTAPPTAAILYDARGEPTARSAEATAWLAVPGIADTTAACVEEVASGRREQCDRALPGALVSAVRLEGSSEHAVAVTLFRSRHPTYGGLLTLTRLQRRIAVLIGLGMNISEVAREVERGVETVRSHVRVVYEVLGVRTRVDLARQLARRTAA